MAALRLAPTAAPMTRDRERLPFMRRFPWGAWVTLGLAWAVGTTLVLTGTDAPLHVAPIAGFFLGAILSVVLVLLLWLLGLGGVVVLTVFILGALLWTALGPLGTGLIVATLAGLGGLMWLGRREMQRQSRSTDPTAPRTGPPAPRPGRPPLPLP